jgi:hypothetical protein
MAGAGSHSRLLPTNEATIQVHDQQIKPQSKSMTDKSTTVLVTSTEVNKSRTSEETILLDLRNSSAGSGDLRMGQGSGGRSSGDGGGSSSGIRRDMDGSDEMVACGRIRRCERIQMEGGRGQRGASHFDRFLQKVLRELLEHETVVSPTYFPFAGRDPATLGDSLSRLLCHNTSVAGTRHSVTPRF